MLINKNVQNHYPANGSTPTQPSANYSTTLESQLALERSIMKLISYYNQQFASSFPGDIADQYPDASPYDLDNFGLVPPILPNASFPPPTNEGTPYQNNQQTSYDDNQPAPSSENTQTSKAIADVVSTMAKKAKKTKDEQDDKKKDTPPKQGVKTNGSGAWVEHHDEGQELLDKGDFTVFRKREGNGTGHWVEKDLKGNKNYDPIEEVKKKPAKMVEVTLDIEGEGSGSDMAVEVYDRRSEEWVVLESVDNKEKDSITFDYDINMGPPIYRVTKYHHDDGRIQNKDSRNKDNVKIVGDSEIAKDGGTSVRDFKGEVDNFDDKDDAEFDDISFRETYKTPVEKDENGEVKLNKKHYRPIHVEVTLEKDAYKEEDNIAVERWDSRKKQWERIMEFPADIEEGRRTQSASFLHYTNESEKPKYRMVDMDSGEVKTSFDETDSDVEGGKIKQKTRTLEGEFERSKEDDYDDITIKEAMENEGLKHNRGMFVYLGTTEGGGVSGFLKGLASIFALDVADKVTEDDFKLEYLDDDGEWVTVAYREDGKNSKSEGINETHEIPLTKDGNIRALKLTTDGKEYNVYDIPEGVFKAKSGVKVNPLAMYINISTIAISIATFGAASPLAIGLQGLARGATAVAGQLAARGGGVAMQAAARGVAAVGNFAASHAATTGANVAARSTGEAVKTVAKEGAKEVVGMGVEGAYQGTKETVKENSDDDGGENSITQLVNEKTAHETSQRVEASGSEGDDKGASVTYGVYDTGIVE